MEEYTKNFPKSVIFVEEEYSEVLTRKDSIIIKTTQSRISNEGEEDIQFDKEVNIQFRLIAIVVIIVIIVEQIVKYSYLFQEYYDKFI